METTTDARAPDERPQCNEADHGHGQEKRRPARDVPVGECWLFRDHRTMAQVIAEGRF
jgi:hypothetical protein